MARPIRSDFHSPTRIALAVSALLALPAAHAFSIDTDNPDVKMRWDNTLKYNASWRLKDPSAKLLADVNLDDGDRNFKKGLVSNRVDWLTEFDASYADRYGFRVSNAAWYDDVYQHSTDNNSPFTANSVTVPYNKFPRGTRDLHGQKTELLDAFVWGKTDIGSMPLTARAGRHSVIYGESLFFGSNGIANAQGPVDIVKLLTVPSSQFKEILRPVEQLSGVLQIKDNLSLSAYYQLRWHETVIPAAGSFLSAADIVGEGAERFIVGAPGGPFLGAPAFWRDRDMKAKNSGQYGFQLKWAPEGSEWEYGLYAARYHDKTPYFYLLPFAGLPNFATGQVGTYKEVYAEGIKTFGASATTSIGQLNLAAEVSVRRDTPLVSDPQVDPFGTANNSDNPLYAVGNSAHAQVSGIYVLTPTALWDGGAVLGEIAWNRRTSVTKNAAAIDAHTTRDAAALRFIFEPQYFQVVPGLDVSVPIGVGYNFGGRSSVIFNWNGGSSNAGDFSIGLKGTYQTVWEFGASYVKFFGPEKTFLTPPNSPTPVLSYGQSLADRDFISINVKRAF